MAKVETSGELAEGYSQVEISIPNDAALSGAMIYAQGIFIDPSPRASVKFAVTEAIAIRID